MRAFAVAVAAALPAAILALSCAIEGFTVGDAGATSSATSGAGGAAGAGGAGGASCDDPGYPRPPADVTVPGEDEFVVAVRSIDLGEKAASPPGIDLDRTCTCCCGDEGPSCLQPTKSCDFAGGVDNAAAKLFKFISFGLDNFSSSFFSKRAEEGHWSIVLRVRGYNGLPDDDKVELDWYMSPGTRGPDNLYTPALWDGKDPWGITPDSVEAPDGGAPDPAAPIADDIPRFVDKLAYVTGGTLVASLPGVDIRVAGATNTILLRLTAGFLIAHIEPEPEADNRPTLTKGLIVGRWKLADVLLALSSYRTSDSEPFCTNAPIYSSAKTTLCNAADIFSGTGTPTTPCDSISMGIGFEAFPAMLGALAALPADLPGCTPETDPANDSCPPPE